MPARGPAAGRKADFPGTGRAPEKGLWPGGLRTAVQYVNTLVVGGAAEVKSAHGVRRGAPNAFRHR